MTVFFGCFGFIHRLSTGTQPSPNHWYFAGVRSSPVGADLEGTCCLLAAWDLNPYSTPEWYVLPDQKKKGKPQMYPLPSMYTSVVI